jgi:hypothetical protein
VELGSARARLGSRASPSRAEPSLIEPEPAREPRAFFPALIPTSRFTCADAGSTARRVDVPVRVSSLISVSTLCSWCPSLKMESVRRGGRLGRAGAMCAGGSGIESGNPVCPPLGPILLALTAAIGSSSLSHRRTASLNPAAVNCRSGRTQPWGPGAPGLGGRCGGGGGGGNGVAKERRGGAPCQIRGRQRGHRRGGAAAPTGDPGVVAAPGRWRRVGSREREVGDEKGAGGCARVGVGGELGGRARAHGCRGTDS